MTKKLMRRPPSPITNILSYLVAVILVLVPFHAFFTTWLGSNFGNLDAFRLWKEILIVFLGTGTLYLLVKNKALRAKFWRSFVVRLALLYVFYSLVRAWAGWVNGAVGVEALLFGLVLNLRFVVFFVLVWLVASQTDFLYKNWLKLLLGPAMLVTSFGLLQQFVLDKNFLRHFGYGENTIPAYQAVDKKPAFARIQSTLRGANPLGAYLLMIITALAALFLQKRQQVLVGVMMMASLVVMFFSYSRSAWIGLAVSFLSLLLLTRLSRLTKTLLLSLSLVAVVITAGGVFVLRNNDYIQNTIFHSDERSSSAASSNQIRYNSLSGGVKDVLDQPLGRGVGTAGPASQRTTQPRIAENYFLQIAQETGVIGLFIFLSFSLIVAVELFRRRQEVLARIMLASLIGICAVNMVSHAWTDDTLSLIWWGFAAIAIARPVILGSETKQKAKSRA